MRIRDYGSSEKNGTDHCGGITIRVPCHDVAGAGKTDESASSFSSRFGFSQSEKEEDPEADAANGPGAAAYADQSKMEEGEGPGIEDVTMSERFHADFGLYELSIRDKYFLYSNVSNGGVTDQPCIWRYRRAWTIRRKRTGCRFPTPPARRCPGEEPM